MPNTLTTTLRSPKAIIITLGGILIMSVGVIIALVLSSQSVDPRKNASVPGGTVEVSISPASRSLNPRESTTLTVTLDTKGIPISGIAARISYPFTGTVPFLTASNPNPLISQRDSNWSCQVVSTTVGTNVVQIDLGCLYVAQSGFISSTPVPLESFTVTAGTPSVATPFTLSFEPASTVVTSKATGEDIAAIPNNTSVITVAVAAATATPTRAVTATPTPTPTQAPGSPTATPTPTLVPGAPTATPTRVVTATPSPTLAPGAPTATPTRVVTATPSPTLAPGAPTATPTPTPVAGLAVCNQTCIATRDCQSGLSCLNGRCRLERCSNDTTCLCSDYNVASESGTTALPDSGGVSYTMLLILMGSLLTISGGSYLLYAFNKP